MNKILVATVAIAVLMVGAAVGPNPALAASTGPGKKAAFESDDFGGSGDIPLNTVTLLTASIVKGKKKQVLVVEATLSGGSSPVSGTLSLSVDVNGVEAEPRGFGGNRVRQQCQDGSFAGLCAVTGTWWLDLDAAELADPGVFINQPLTVTLKGGDGGGPQSDGKVTMSVRMQKK